MKPSTHKKKEANIILNWIKSNPIRHFFNLNQFPLPQKGRWTRWVLEAFLFAALHVYPVDGKLGLKRFLCGPLAFETTAGWTPSSLPSLKLAVTFILSSLSNSDTKKGSTNGRRFQMPRNVIGAEKDDSDVTHLERQLPQVLSGIFVHLSLMAWYRLELNGLSDLLDHPYLMIF